MLHNVDQSIKGGGTSGPAQLENAYLLGNALTAFPTVILVGARLLL
jgi:hypothetical protein